MRIVLSFLIVGALAIAVVELTGLDLGKSTDCFADFPSKSRADAALKAADAAGIDTGGTVTSHGSSSIRMSSGETGADAADFRATFRRIAFAFDGKPEQAACIERPFFN
jgi:hypothetical protein